MQYDYSLHYNDVQHAWQVTWSCYDLDNPHKMKGDLALCNSFEEAIASMRSFVAQFESERLDAIA